MREVLSKRAEADTKTPVRFGNFDIMNDADGKPVPAGKQSR